MNCFIKNPCKQFYCFVTLLFISLNVSAQTSQTTTKDTLVELKNWRSGKDTIRLNDELAIKIITEKPDSFFNTIFINSIPVLTIDDLKHQSVDSCKKCKIFLFQLTNSFFDSLKIIGKGSRDESGFLKLNFSIGNRQQACIINALPIVVEQNQLIEKWLVKTLLVLTIFILIFLLWKYNGSLIKGDDNIYYSLGRTQLLYWSLLFIYGYLFICSCEGTLPFIPNSLLIILGISVGTTAASKLIDNSSVPLGTQLDLSKSKSQGFFIDILSDANSISVHRFQNVIFNIIFGVIFLQKVIAEHKLPDFDNTVLILMGISSGSYAALKTTEPQNSNIQNPTNQAVG